MSVDLVLGQRPDEPGPPISGRSTYPPDVTARLAADAEQIIARYPHARSALLPLLHLVQSEDGYLTPAGIAFCAANSASPPPKSPRWPPSTRCTGARRPASTCSACAPTRCARSWAATPSSKRSRTIWASTPGRPPATDTITLEHVECNAACDYAPVVMVNWEFFDNQTPSSARDLVDALRAGEPVVPTRGAPLCTFRETARTLAGLPDSRGGDPDQTGAATLAGLRVAQDSNMTAPEPPPASHTSGEEPAGTQPEAVESTKDEPAPAPTTTVPAEPATTETDPSATGSDK